MYGRKNGNIIQAVFLRSDVPLTLFVVSYVTIHIIYLVSFFFTLALCFVSGCSIYAPQVLIDVSLSFKSCFVIFLKEALTVVFLPSAL